MFFYKSTKGDWHGPFETKEEGQGSAKFWGDEIAEWYLIVKENEDIPNDRNGQKTNL